MATRVRSALARLGRALWALPEWAPIRPVRVTPRLRMFVTATWLVAVTLALTVMPWSRDHDWVAAAVAGVDWLLGMFCISLGHTSTKPLGER